MTNRLRPAALAAGFVLMAVPAGAQTQRATEPPPNVPAITGDRQPVPMPRPGAPGTGSTQGSATGLVTMEQRPKLREYALKHRDAEQKLQVDLRVGSVLPADATLLDIPPEFNLAQFRLALANQKTLLVDPASRRIEEVIE